MVKPQRLLTLAAMSLVGTAVAAPNQPVTGPIATYWMSASTTSGMGGMMGGMGGPGMGGPGMAGPGGWGGGQRPNFGAMMGGGFDPNAVSKSLTLQLGTSLAAQGDPMAEHDPPDALGVGPMLPLVSPQPAAPGGRESPAERPQYSQPSQPKGRMLIFWGCGEHASPGQPMVIDFANMGRDAAAAKFAQLRGFAINPPQPPSLGRDRSYGEWPNAQSTARVGPDASLQGAHTVRGNYTPTINFTLAANQDFLPPVRRVTNQKNPTGSATLGWRPVDGALGYVASMIGGSGGREGDSQVVMWTSSATLTSAFALPQYLTDGEIRELVAAQALMAPEQTSCTIPAEAVQAAGRAGLYQFTAYGGETNIAYPPRPPAPKPWHIDWTVKVRYRAATSGIVGVNMDGMGGYPRQGPQDPSQRPKPHRNPFGFPGIPNPMGGIIP